MEGAPTHQEVAVLSPNQKERLSDALLRLIEKKITTYNRGDKTPIYEKDITFMYHDLSKEEDVTPNNVTKPEHIKPEDVRNFILSRSDCEITKDIVRVGPQHTIRTILRSSQGERKASSDSTQQQVHTYTLSNKDRAAGEKETD